MCCDSTCNVVGRSQSDSIVLGNTGSLKGSEARIERYIKSVVLIDTIMVSVPL